MFKIAVSERPHKRRGVLSIVSSIHDPLGFLAPLIPPSKLLLQELCKRNIKWDSEMPQTLSRQWSEWLQDLNKITMVKVDRCIKSKDFGMIRTAQLHHFSDASQCGYQGLKFSVVTTDFRQLERVIDGFPSITVFRLFLIFFHALFLILML